MTWTYRQKTGHLYRDGYHYSTGYAGKGEGLNNPEMQNKVGIGPLPVGLYHIGPALKHPRLGLLAMFLDPDDANEMFGRSEFFIHGDNRKMNNTASNGCIVLARFDRKMVDKSPDRRLEVVQG